MNAVALIAIYIVPVLFAHACHAIGRSRSSLRPVCPPAPDEIDHNFDSMWEAAARR